MELIIIIAIVVIAATVGKKYWKWIIGVPVALLVFGMFGNHPIIILILVATIGILIYSNSETVKSKRMERRFNAWIKQNSESNYTYDGIAERMEGLGRALPFSGDEVPFGRAEYFASSFENIFGNGDIVYGYYPIRSSIDSELREYGIVVTNRGIGIATQVLSKDTKDKESRFVVDSVELLFSGMWFVTYDEEKQTITICSGLKEAKIKLEEYPLLNYGLLVANTDRLIKAGFTRDLYTGLIDEKFNQSLDNDLANLEADEQDGDDNRKAMFDEYSHVAEKNLNASADASAINTGSRAQAGGTSARNLHNIQINQMVNGRQGHGVAAEYANSVLDGGFLTNSGLRGQDNAKHGPDRLSFGKKVQVKTSIRLDSNGQYAGKNSADSIKLAFKDGNTQKMGKYQYGEMPTEVPKDQYRSSIEYMRKQIEKGNVEGHTDPNDASKLVKCGLFEGDRYARIVKAGTIESLTVDSLNAVEQSLPTIGITFIMTYASARWQGAEKKDAAKIAGGSAISAGVMSAGAILFSSQAAKSKIGQKLVSSGLAKSIGLKQGAEDIGKYAGNIITVAITFGPLTVDALRGRISTKQLFKGSVLGSVSIAVGLVSGPAGIITAPVAGYFTKKVLDIFVEDDAKEMYQVFKEEFLDVVMVSGLTHEEFQEILKMTFQNKKLGSWLKDMFAANDSRNFARNILVSEAVSDILSKREKITNEEVIDAYATAKNDYVSA
ncbi:hypothetical protein [Levilactobacillus cerevisiae]|uniref:hypothetical protein n=1 Tax=Levilactobacillus cerevisiae TaxID=1704076 RepID=UPI000F78B434|nr:hypothetical protein [Levilactobacillus cerevisiae]